MSDVNLNVETLTQYVSESTESFFDTMLGWSVEFKGSLRLTKEILKGGKYPPKIEIYVSNVGFAGRIGGTVYVPIPSGLAFSITATMLGMSPEEVLEEGDMLVMDCLGEVANIVGGGFKNKLCDLGLECKLTTPSVCRGHDMSIKTPDTADRYLYRFGTQGKDFFVDLTVGQPEP